MLCLFGVVPFVISRLFGGNHRKAIIVGSTNDKHHTNFHGVRTCEASDNEEEEAEDAEAADARGC